MAKSEKVELRGASVRNEGSATRRGRRKAPGRKKAAAAGGISSAEVMARKQRDISVSEFFAKNRHLLGFDNPAKAKRHHKGIFNDLC